MVGDEGAPHLFCEELAAMGDNRVLFSIAKKSVP